MRNIVDLVLYKSKLARKLASYYYLRPTAQDHWPILPGNFLEPLANLQRDGVVAIRGQYADFAEFIDHEYLANPEIGLKSGVLRDFNSEAEKQTGTTQYFELKFNSPRVDELFFNEGICSLLFHYYGRQPYYRNNILLKTQEILSSHVKHFQGKFHVDGGLRQLSFMMLLNDITEQDTHMEYAIGSHQTEGHGTLDRFKYNDSDILTKYPIFKLIGKRGDFFLFDAGNGFHRAVYKEGTVRRILHMNVTSGGYFSAKKEYKTEDLAVLQGKSSYVNHTMDMLKVR